MYKHLFLEAESGAGKSTLIREVIKPYINDVGGFSSQRLLDDCGNTIAFRVVPAYDLRLAAPYEKTTESIFRTISDDNHGESHTEVFDAYGMTLLNGYRKKKLILLDEIGGIELKSTSFRNKILEILSSSIPCIGVIKQHQKAARIDYGSISAHNHELRTKMMEDHNCKVIQFKRNDPAVEGEVRSFIDRIFK